MSDDRAERLARQIRSACGQYNNDDLPVVVCVTQMGVKLAAAESTIASQLDTIKALTVGTDGSTPAIVQLGRMEEKVRVLREALDAIAESDPDESSGRLRDIANEALATTAPEGGDV